MNNVARIVDDYEIIFLIRRHKINHGVRVLMSPGISEANILNFQILYYAEEYIAVLYIY